MKIPEYPIVHLTICVFYLAQLTIVGDHYSRSALFIDDLLTGDASRQLLRRSRRCRAAQHQDSECQDHPVHDFATPQVSAPSLGIQRGAEMLWS
jgi:hypothetical protein